MSTLKSINDSEYQSEVLDSSEPVVLDFWAPWCGPCKALTPKLEQISAKFEGKVKFLKINVDDNPQTASQLGVRGIPSVFMVKNGEVVDQFVGNQAEDLIEEMVNKLV